MWDYVTVSASVTVNLRSLDLELITGWSSMALLCDLHCKCIEWDSTWAILRVAARFCVLSGPTVPFESRWVLFRSNETFFASIYTVETSFRIQMRILHWWYTITLKIKGLGAWLLPFRIIPNWFYSSHVYCSRIYCLFAQHSTRCYSIFTNLLWRPKINRATCSNPFFNKGSR